MNDREQVYIVDGARTPFGAFGQSLGRVSATELGRISAAEALRRSGIAPERVGHVVYGHVIHSAVDAAYLARHIALKAGVKVETPALSVNRLCGSGMQAVITAAQTIRLGEADVCLAGGAENMSQAPHADFTSRFGGAKLGHLRLEDMLLHTLTDAYIGCGMGVTAERLASRYAISRDEQDEYAAASHSRAARATDDGTLAEEIVVVEVAARGGAALVGRDEHIRRDTTAARLATLKPAFVPDGGTVTAGNASGINDGAASLVLAGERGLDGRKPLARIAAWGIAGVEPDVMGIGPVPAARIALARCGLTIADIDLVEINEAFAVQAIAVERELGLDRARTNVNGGAIAIGHPVGASGARIVLTLAYELRRRNKRYGLAALCVGGGQGVAVVIENVAG
ncbi:acetyl-CoA C-acyltransferase [Paenibacillus sp. GYB003]|uniref:acetyl-CoA C-acyltransferase n=1 Tax=Paenibacillus sp. GYB003 TaxID=2994392 RepID=UPI002F961C50